MIFLLATACSTLDPLTKPVGEQECAYSIEDVATHDETCFDTRPYYEIGASVDYSVDEYDTLDLHVSAAPEDGIGMDEFSLAISATPGWNLEEVLSMEFPDGDVRPIVVSEDGSAKIDVDLELSAGEDATYTLIFDRAGLDTDDTEYLYVGYGSIQTWHSEGGCDATTKFRDLGRDNVSESLGIEF